MPRTAARSTHDEVPALRFAIAWALMVGGLVGWWSCRARLGSRAFDIGQLVVLLSTWKAASLLCLPPGAWKRFTPLRLLAYGIWPGMQPRQFLKGQATAAGAPVPRLADWAFNVAAGAVLFWLVPRLLPESTPRAVRLAIALVGFTLLFLIARFDAWAFVFRRMGFAVERAWDRPASATSLGEFWGRRWNRIVSGLLREVVFRPLARRVGARPAMLAVFLYSGFYHEIVSVMARSGYGGPTLYFLIQFGGVAIEDSRAGRKLLRGRPGMGRAWTLAVVALPVGLFLHPGFVDGYLVPMLIEAGVPGISPSGPLRIQ